MQQTLLRFLLTDWFAVESREGVWHVGIGFLLIPWVALGLLEIRAARKSGESLKQQQGSITTWAAIAAGILCVPFFADRIPTDSIPVFGWGFMLVLGFISAGLVTIRRGKAIGIPREVIESLGFHIFVSGIVGARAFYLIQYREEVFKNASNPVQFLQAILTFANGGMVLYGGVLLGIATYIWFCHKNKIPAFLLGDLVIPAIFIGLGFGRLGCLLNGCCFGDVCQLPWSIYFPPQSPPYQALLSRGFLEPGAEYSLPLHPTQIYSSLNAFLLAGLSTVWFRYRQRDGEILVLALLTYPVMRFTIEFLRSDEFGVFQTELSNSQNVILAFFSRLTISQLVSIGLFFGGLLLLLWLRSRPAMKTPLPLKIELPHREARQSSAQAT